MEKMKRIYKKAQISPINLIIGIIVVGLVLFFILKFTGVFNKSTPIFNVTKINATVSYVAGGIKVTNGDNIFKNNSANKTLITVIYPNKTLTPGAIMSTNLTEICTSGYAASVRDVPQSVKDQVYAEYKLSPNQPTGAFELDALIPIQLGGSNDIKNLWPQPANPKPGFHEKDVLEDYLHNQVCLGKMSLQEAQNIQINNWLLGYIQMKQNEKK